VLLALRIEGIQLIEKQTCVSDSLGSCGSLDIACISKPTLRYNCGVFSQAQRTGTKATEVERRGTQASDLMGRRNRNCMAIRSYWLQKRVTKMRLQMAILIPAWLLLLFHTMIRRRCHISMTGHKDTRWVHRHALLRYTQTTRLWHRLESNE